jgi:hypothetical protein
MNHDISDLLKIKEPLLPHKGIALDWRHAASGRPSFGGVYVFWWRGGAKKNGVRDDFHIHLT